MGQGLQGQAFLHWLAMSDLLEDLGSHVAWRSTRRREDMESLFVHNAAEPKVGDEQVGIVFGCSEQQVLRLQIAVDNTMVVQVGDGRQRSAHQVRRVGLVVAALPAYPVEQLAAQREVGHKVD